MRNMKKYNALDFKTKLEKHKQWVKTGGRVGSQLSLDEMDLTEKYNEDFLIEQSFLTACNFSNVVFEKTDFYCAEQYSCIFNNAKFKECDFYKATLEYCDINQVELIDCKFGRTDFYETNFKNSSFKNCSFVGISLMHCDLSNSILDNIDFDYSYFLEVKVNGTRFINPKNLEKATKLSLDVSSDETPHIIEGEEAIKWILEHNQ